MKKYIQLYDNYVVMIKEVLEEGEENFIEVELPEDFNYNHIDWYEYVDGELIYHDHSNDYPVIPSQEERITALEEQLAAYEQSYAKGVQDA